MLRRARLLRRACPTLVLANMTKLVNLLKDRSQLAMDTAIVNKICSKMHRFGFDGAQFDEEPMKLRKLGSAKT